MHVKIELEGAERLQQRLKDPQVIKGPLAGLLEEAGYIGLGAARGALTGGTEYAVKSLSFTVHPLYAEVHTKMPLKRALSIEKGRSAGETASILSLARWLTGRLYLTSSRLDTLTQAERASAIKAQRAIKARGAKAKKYMDSAKQAVKKQMPVLVAKMARRIEEMFQR